MRVSSGKGRRRCRKPDGRRLLRVRTPAISPAPRNDASRASSNGREETPPPPLRLPFHSCRRPASGRHALLARRQNDQQLSQTLCDTQANIQQLEGLIEQHLHALNVVCYFPRLESYRETRENTARGLVQDCRNSDLPATVLAIVRVAKTRPVRVMPRRPRTLLRPDQTARRGVPTLHHHVAVRSSVGVVSVIEFLAFLACGWNGKTNSVG